MQNSFHPSLKLILTLLSVFVLFIYQCQKKTSQQTKITFWAMGAEGEHVQKLVPEFENKYSNISVEVQMIPWTAAQEKLITAYASDNTPDVFQLGNTWIPQFAALNAIESLDDRIQQTDNVNSEDYFNGIWNTNIIDGKVYGIPWYIDTRVLFYRKDILAKAGYQQPPKSWDDLYRISKDIKKIQPDKNKYAIYIPTNEWSPFVIFGLQNGAKLLKQNNCYGNFSGQKFKEAFEFLIRFHKENLAPVGISQVSNIYQAFANEYFTMYISGPWNVNEFKQWMTGNLKNKWMTAPLPDPDGEYPGVSLAGGSSLVISSDSENKDAAWNLVEYLSDPTIQLQFYELTYDLPAVKKAWQDSTLMNDPYMKAFYTQFHHVVPIPKIPEWEQIAFSKIQQYAEMAARGAISIEEALQALDKDVNKILEKRRWLLSQD